MNEKLKLALVAVSDTHVSGVEVIVCEPTVPVSVIVLKSEFAAV